VLVPVCTQADGFLNPPQVANLPHIAHNLIGVAFASPRQ
jgi:hypothetical protein